MTTWATMSCFMVSSTLMPVAKAFAGQATHTVKVGETLISIPNNEYAVLSTVQFAPSRGFSASTIEGSKVNVNLDRAAEFAGVKASQIPDMVNAMPSSSAMVFGRYSERTMELRVDIVKVQRAGNTVTVASTQFTPTHGNLWAAQRTLMTPAEKAATTGPGPNPFVRYDQNDGLFHNIGFAAAQVVVGAAMRNVGASMSTLSIQHTDIRSRQEKSGGMLRKKITYIYEGFTKPIWYVGLPREMQAGTDSVICTDNGVEKCTPEHMLMPFASFVEWSGGNLPDDTTKVYDYRYTKKSWTVLAMAIFFTALSFAAVEAYALASGAAASQAGVVTTLLGSGFPAAGIEGAGLLTVGGVQGAVISVGIEGMTYLGAETVFNGANGGSPQDSFVGHVSSSTEIPAVDDSVQGKAVRDIERSTQLLSPLGQSAAYNAAHLGGISSTVTQFDTGYNMVKPEVGSSKQFNSWQYVNDTK